MDEYTLYKKTDIVHRPICIGPWTTKAIPPPFFNILSKLYSIAICHSSMSYLPPLSRKQKTHVR